MNSAIDQIESGDNTEGHVTLRYQPALPISRGKFAVWLFLSTEIMFFYGVDRHVHRTSLWRSSRQLASPP